MQSRKPDVESEHFLRKRSRFHGVYDKLGELPAEKSNSTINSRIGESSLSTSVNYDRSCNSKISCRVIAFKFLSLSRHVRDIVTRERKRYLRARARLSSLLRRLYVYVCVYLFLCFRQREDRKLASRTTCCFRINVSNDPFTLFSRNTRATIDSE